MFFCLGYFISTLFRCYLLVYIPCVPSGLCLSLPVLAGDLGSVAHCMVMLGIRHTIGIVHPW